MVIAGDEEGAVDKACGGCSRSQATGRCWFRPDEITPWALPHRRGAWCRDCHTVWRTCFSHEHTLNFFSGWLRTSANRENFELHMIGFLTLVFEEESRITFQMVVDRIKVHMSSQIMQVVGVDSIPSHSVFRMFPW